MIPLFIYYFGFVEKWLLIIEIIVSLNFYLLWLIVCLILLNTLSFQNHFSVTNFFSFNGPCFESFYFLNINEMRVIVLGCIEYFMGLIC